MSEYVGAGIGIETLTGGRITGDARGGGINMMYGRRSVVGGKTMERAVVGG